MDGGTMELDGGSSGEEENDEQYDWHRLGYNPQVQDGGYDPQLENVRMESIQKIRGRFEHIYQKYGKDFEGVADEIDMTTGIIVVNNGHLQNMEHEVDAGNGDALALSRTFGDDEDDDEDEDGSSGSESEAVVDQDGGHDSNSVHSDDPELDFSWQDDTAASLTSPDEELDAPPKPTATRPPIPTDGQKCRKGKERAASNAPAKDSSSDEILGHMKDSMLALKDKYENGQDMAPDDIQALGGKASKKRKRQSAPTRLESVEDSRGRRRHRSQNSVDPVAPTPACSPGNISLWAPLNQPKGRRTPKKKKRKSAGAEDQTGDDSLIDSIVLQTIMDQSALEPDELQGPTTVRSCSNCKTTETLHWRRGPKAIDLCNNCGMYYYRYGVMRPLHTSPPPREKTPTPEPEHIDPRQKPAPYSANTSRPLDGVNLFGLHFSVREDAQLIKLKEIDRLTWDQIAMQHPGRTPYALQCRYSKNLHGKPCEARDVLSSRGFQFYVDSNGLTIAHQPGKFTEEEDDMLLKLREEDDLDWNGVALELPGRTAEDVQKRYDEMMAEYVGRDDAKGSKPKLKPKPKPKKRRRDSNASDRSNARYTPDEDDTILRLREDDKLSWQDVSKQMRGRTLASVQRHYSRDIGPYGRSRSSTPRGSPAPGEAHPRSRKYTDEEDAMLMRLRDEEDLEWEQIADQLPERSASSLANRYYYKNCKDNSRASSRASSVASSPRRHTSSSLPVLDLVAQLDNVQVETPSEEDTFTEAEDGIIIKLRELECLSWDQIAAEMPGRDVSSISCRYYQYLLPRKVPEIRGTEQALDPALQSPGFNAQPEASKDITGGRIRDNDAVVDGLAIDTTADTADAPKAAPARSGSNARKRKSDVNPQGRSVAGRRSDAPMLRRALQKNLNRRSESQLAVPAALPDMSMMMDGANDDVVVDGDELSESHNTIHEPTLLPSALPVSNQVQPLASERKLRSSSKRKSMYPETPLRESNGPYPSSGPTALDPALYFTPSRYQAQSHPYFLANAASPAEPPVPVLPNRKARAGRAAVDSQARSDESEGEIATEGGKRPFRKRRRAPKPTRAARPRQVQIQDTNDEDDDLDDSADDTAGEYFTSRKKKKGPSDAQKQFRGRMSTAADMTDESATVEVQSRSRALSVDLEGETEEEDVDMPDLGTDDDDDSSESGEEEEDDDELRCKPRERSPLFDPRETIEEAKHKKEVGPMRGKLTTAAKAGDGHTMDDLNPDIDISSIPPEHLVRPDISWTQLNFIALKSRAPEPMHTREIYAYLEQHFPFFRLCKGHWRDSIRGNLSTRPEFVKHSGNKAALWCLADPDQEAIVVPKGERRGRCPIGVTPRPKEVKLPKKLGRPSNASKGLPLKRVYTRNYIPAAERRRLAELEAETAAAVVDGDVGEAENALDIDGTMTMHPAAPDTATNAELGDEAAASRPQANVDARPTRPSTIDDSDAGEQFEFVDCPADPPNDTDIEIKTEPQLPEPTFTAPVARMIAHTSDINREPESSSSDPPAPNNAAAAAVIDELSSEATPASISTYMHQPGLRSSSPALASATTSTRRLSRTYGKVSTINTPGTGRSTLFKQLAAGSASPAVKASPAFAHIARSSGSRAATPGSLRRTVQTPVRETDESEDELA